MPSSYRRRVTVRVSLSVPRDVTAADAPAYVKGLLLAKIADLSPTVEAVTNTGIELAETPGPSREEIDAAKPKERALPGINALKYPTKILPFNQPRKLPPLKKK